MSVASQTKLTRLGGGIFKGALPPFLSVACALVIGAVLLAIGGNDPVQAYLAMLSGAFGSTDRMAETLVKMTPLLIVGLAVSIPYRAEIWTIGPEGQLVMGAILSTWVGLTLAGLPPLVLLPLTLVAGFVGGAVWGLVPGILRAKLEVNEVITTLMLNYVAIYFLGYLVRGPMMDPHGFNFPQSRLLPASLHLIKIIPGTRLNVAFILALFLMVVLILFWRTTLGFRTEIVGGSRVVAKYAGIDVSWNIIFVMLLSGGLSGIAGWGEIFGIHHRLLDEISGGYGYLGMVIALLGGLHPLGIALASFLFAALVVGGNAMERAVDAPFAVVSVIQGLVILFVLARTIFTLRRSAVAG
ncbi:MAG: ABC transporter permease [Chloroflexi bacterium]|nr:ABC transporter permease [Chloroflexota bacterium]MCL5076470.1 ABC transporter permease [Chloroflexota bacterium]